MATLVPSELPATYLARNLVVARLAAGVTQHSLAADSDVSRATIAQIETGCGDPRLSTIAALAAALSIPPIFLLLGPAEIRLLTRVAKELTAASVSIPPRQLQTLERQVGSGMLKDRVRAGKLAAEIVRELGFASTQAPVTAAICAAIVPDPGVALGALLGESVGESSGDRP